jgi:hypothetical protein
MTEMIDLAMGSLNKVPKLLLEQLVRKKLDATGVDLPTKAKRALVKHVLEGRGKTFRWENPNDEDLTASIVLEFTESDIQEAEAAFKRVADGLPQELDRITGEQSERMFNDLVEKWTAEHAAQSSETTEFQQRLEERWGEGLNLLRILLTITREIGGERAKKHLGRRGQKASVRMALLVRLHVRACQVTQEIICLLEGGLADGAMARWRTLYEIAVTATMIADGDEDLADRYVSHQIVEEWRRLEEDLCAAPNRQLSSAELRERDFAKTEYDAILAKYGASFGGLYGWAAHHLKLKKPTFKNLQEAAGRAGENPFYKLASVNVHAGTRAIFDRLAGLDRPLPLIAGRSNAGLETPGGNTAYTLTQITGALVGCPTTLDDVLGMKVILNVRDAIPRAFNAAAKKLWEDEQAFRAATKTPNNRRKARA